MALMMFGLDRRWRQKYTPKTMVCLQMNTFIIVESGRNPVHICRVRSVSLQEAYHG